MEDLEKINIAIDAIIQQIEMISKRSLLESNRKDLDDGYLVELSSIMLQLIRSLNELLLAKQLYERGALDQNKAVDFLINGRTR